MHKLVTSKSNTIISDTIYDKQVTCTAQVVNFMFLCLETNLEGETHVTENSFLDHRTTLICNGKLAK